MICVPALTPMPEMYFPSSRCSPCFSQQPFSNSLSPVACKHNRFTWCQGICLALPCLHVGGMQAVAKNTFTKPCSICRDNHASASGRGVVFVGGPNSTTYARRGGTAGGRGAGAPGGGPANSAYNLLRLQTEGAAALGTTDRAVEGPPQVNRPGHVCVPCLRVCMHVCN